MAMKSKTKDTDFKKITEKDGSFNKTGKQSNLAEIAVLSLNDFARIKKNSTIISKEEEKNKLKIAQDQKENLMAGSIAKKELIKEIDKNKADKKKLSDITLDPSKFENVPIDRKIEEEHDLVKTMNKMVMNTQINLIREKQIEQTKQLASEYKLYHQKLDTLMEVDRLRELQLQEERDKYRKEQKMMGAVVIIDQIKDKELERLRNKDIQERERQMMLRQIKELEEEEKRIQEVKKIHAELMSKEVEYSNKRAIDIKEKKKLEEKEVDLKIHQYVIEKARKEEEELAEKKRIQEEKEKEVARLREKQEKVKDKQAENDMIKAKRATEETERQIRRKEKMEIELKKKKVEELIIANEKAKIEKEIKMAEVAKINHEEYVKIIDKQIKDNENERKKQDEYKQKLLENNENIKKQIMIKEEMALIKKRESMEEGIKLKQKQMIEKAQLEKIKKMKMEQIKKMTEDQKHLFDLNKFKIN